MGKRGKWENEGKCIKPALVYSTLDTADPPRCGVTIKNDCRIEPRATCDTYPGPAYPSPDGPKPETGRTEKARKHLDQGLSYQFYR